MRLLDGCKDVILISFGAAIGANIRLLIYKKLDKLNLSKNSIILLINTCSSFFLGFFSSFFPQIASLSYAYQLALFFSIGVLGSLSTFSAFIYDLYYLFINNKIYIAFKLLISSLILGLLAFGVGFLLALL